MGDPEHPLRTATRALITAALEADGRSAEAIAAKIWGEAKRRSGGERIRYAQRTGWGSPEVLVPLGAEIGLEVVTARTRRPTR